MRKCPNCAAEVAEGANFCATCGASLRPLAIGRMMEDARRALDANPDDLSARYNLALAHKLAGMDDLALQEFERVAERQPDFADVHLELAQLYLKAGRREKAVTALRRVLELEPEHDGARRLLARAEKEQS
jgi:tetratricopeptide (TPR) repeat protein